MESRISADQARIDAEVQLVSRETKAYNQRQYKADIESLHDFKKRQATSSGRVFPPHRSFELEPLHTLTNLCSKSADQLATVQAFYDGNLLHKRRFVKLEESFQGTGKYSNGSAAPEDKVCFGRL